MTIYYPQFLRNQFVQALLSPVVPRYAWAHQAAAGTATKVQFGTSDTWRNSWWKRALGFWGPPPMTDVPGYDKKIPLLLPGIFDDTKSTTMDAFTPAAPIGANQSIEKIGGVQDFVVQWIDSADDVSAGALERRAVLFHTIMTFGHMVGTEHVPIPMALQQTLSQLLWHSVLYFTTEPERANVVASGINMVWHIAHVLGFEKLTHAVDQEDVKTRTGGRYEPKDLWAQEFDYSFVNVALSLTENLPYNPKTMKDGMDWTAVAVPTATATTSTAAWELHVTSMIRTYFYPLNRVSAGFSKDTTNQATEQDFAADLDPVFGAPAITIGHVFASPSMPLYYLPWGYHRSRGQTLMWVGSDDHVKNVGFAPYKQFAAKTEFKFA